MNNENNQKEELKFPIVFVGHVDHGKSTLIGRLLYDTDSLPEQKISEVKKVCEEQGREFEFAFLMDHMQEERDQNITIDTAQIFFNTKKRDYVIIDAPGHVEFTKNMITGASQADAAILIVDVNEGAQEQTRRHAKFLSLLGIKQVLVVANKLDQVDYSEDKFSQAKQDVEKFLSGIDIKPLIVIPISAKEGDNIVKKSDKMDWYTGKTLTEALDDLQPQESMSNKPFRMAVQETYKFDDKRIIAGQILSGRLKTGDPVVFLPADSKSTVKSIEKYPEPVPEAEAGEGIGITLDDPLFIDRGNIAVDPDNQPKMVDEVKAKLFWMSKEPLNLSDNLTLQCATQEIGVTIESLTDRINSSTLEIVEEKASELAETEIASVVFKADDKVVAEDFNQVPELGRFVLIKDGAVVAGGIITNLD